MNKETAEKIVSHMKAALELDPENKAIKKTNADRMQFSIGGIETRIANGEFPTLARLRRELKEKIDAERDNESGN